MEKENRKHLRGFASMNTEARRKIASLGGKAVSSNKEHMALIGQKGGEISGRNRRKPTSVVQRVTSEPLEIEGTPV